jgi:hypothetical protein
MAKESVALPKFYGLRMLIICRERIFLAFDARERKKKREKKRDIQD